MISDSTIDRAITNLIPVYGSLANTNNNEYEFCFTFNSLVLDIKNVSTTDNTIFSKINSFNVDFNNLTNSILRVKSSELRSSNNGVLFYIAIEGLAGSDTVTSFTPSCYKKDGKDITEVSLQSANINVRSTPIGIKFIEGLGLNSPNPFNNETKIPFTIENDTKVSFNMFSLNGRRVIGNDLSFNTFDMKIFKDDGNEVSDIYSYIFTKGKYFLILKSRKSDISVGAYYLNMTTSRSTYQLNIMLIK
ncbi:MAG TPA: hypothetical protein PLE30_08535 [Candidatus Kapabacteria bacterium]|nr:hypothetical protein [Candidatus Kapabacteria bacterium]